MSRSGGNTERATSADVIGSRRRASETSIALLRSWAVAEGHLTSTDLEAGSAQVFDKAGGDPFAIGGWPFQGPLPALVAHVTVITDVWNAVGRLGRRVQNP